MTILEKIIQNTQLELARKKRTLPVNELQNRAEKIAAGRPSFLHALNSTEISIIAEVKKASPSKGVIAHDFDPVAIAKDYEQGGAAAISVLTDQTFFKGSLEYLEKISKNSSLPLLRKDFIIDEYQIYEAKLHGASAILLLASVLDHMHIRDLLETAHELNLDVLLEVHDETDLFIALKTGAHIIGVNNRDLKTFQVDLGTSERLVREIPPEIIKVSESGISSFEDISRLQRSGFHAFLVGESLMRQPDRVAHLKELRGL